MAFCVRGSFGKVIIFGAGGVAGSGCGGGGGGGDGGGGDREP